MVADIKEGRVYVASTRLEERHREGICRWVRGVPIHYDYGHDCAGLAERGRHAWTESPGGLTRKCQGSRQVLVPPSTNLQCWPSSALLQINSKCRAEFEARRYAGGAIKNENW